MNILSTHNLTKTYGTGDNVCLYTHLRAHETGRNLVCRLLLEKKKKPNQNTHTK